MSFFNRCCGSTAQAVLLAIVFGVGVASAQDYSGLGISDLVGVVDRMLQSGNYDGAIPALKEIVSRTSSMSDAQGKETCQNARFQLARSYVRSGKTDGAMLVMEEYLNNDPRKKEQLVLRMMAQSCFDTQDWTKIEELCLRLLSLKDLEKEERYTANLLLGQ
ncbi:MAG TPA: tetratricopeptide repeat protein, partial [Pontiella sp.]